MKFAVYFDLIRPRKEEAAEAWRIVELEAVSWNELSTPWLLLAFEHFAVMIDRMRRDDPDVKPEFWIGMRQRLYSEIMRRARRQENVSCLT